MQLIGESKEQMLLITNIDRYLKQPGTHQTITIWAIP